MACPKNWIVGLTGGIGSGKSCAARIFSKMGARVIDTDDISHELSCPPSPALDEIAKQFGPSFLRADGTLDRPRMRAHVFSDTQSRKTLEAIFHPIIQQRVHNLLQEASGAPYTILVVPLLFETASFLKFIHHSIAIECDKEIQISRVMARSNLTREDVIAIMSTQLPSAERAKQADDLIHNNGTLLDLENQIQRLHQRFLLLSNSVQ